MMREYFEKLGPTRTLVLVTLAAAIGMAIITLVGLHLSGLTVISAYLLIPIFATFIVLPIAAYPLINLLFKTFSLERTNYRLASYDQLTNLMARRAFISNADSYLNLARRKKSPFAIAFLDLDNFKQVNDQLGHAMGDILLQEIGKTLNTIRRKSDMIGRYGGDEFVILLPETDLSGAEYFTDKIHQAVKHIALPEQGSIKISVSIGVITRRQDNQYMTLEGLIDQADEALYMAKSEGKGRTVFYVKKGPPTKTKQNDSYQQRTLGNPEAA
ncbi:MAG: GGDEF domain-containing protein [Porticoccaceae bacterium]|nr:GGDEF domain-containing protein [Porticoccaceae bacterium]